MSRILIVAHAPLASALKAVAAHAFPEAAAAVAAVDVVAAAQPEQVAQQLRSLLAEGETALILCDAMGATPCNAAQQLIVPGRVHVVAGVNVPMLWRALCYAAEPIASQTQRALLGATGGVVLVPAFQASDHAQANRHDQQ